MGATRIDSILLAVKWWRLILGDIELLQLCLGGDEDLQVTTGAGGGGGSID